MYLFIRMDGYIVSEAVFVVKDPLRPGLAGPRLGPMTDLHPALTVLDHPLLQHKLTRLRNAETPTPAFRRLVREIASLMGWSIFRHLPLDEIEVTTPLETTLGAEIAVPVTIVPVLRAGLGLTEGLLAVLPEARVGHIGLERDEKTAKPSTYYTRLPDDLHEGLTVLVDPMLATGGSCAHALHILREHGAERIVVACLVAAPEGVSALAAEFPDVPVLTAALDRELDENAYIRPGLGDAGDRIFGTT